MTTATLEAPESATDPLQAIAEAMALAADAMGDDNSKGGTTMESTIAGTTSFISRFTYSLFYFTSYGVVFPTMFVASTVPGLGQVAAGLVEGANAASDAVNKRKAKQAQRRAERAVRKAAKHDPDRQRVKQEGVECLAGA
jgi:hypothetical protein